MKQVLTFFLTVFFLPAIIYCQENNFWVSAPTGETKIYSVIFSNELIGKAVSAEGDVLITFDGGESWTVNSKSSIDLLSESKRIFLSADIYCSVMRTTDSGNTWLPYEKEKQEHFCGVYLKDPNSGFEIASDFLEKVTGKILEHFKANKMDLLINNPQQCTEYFTNASEGWALGWCVKDFKSTK